MILFGHPTGNPNSHHAALAHFEARRLAAFCVPWMPSSTVLKILAALPGQAGLAQRFARRRFAPLEDAATVQGRLGEFRRLLLRTSGRGDESLSYEANDWLMETMRRECRRSIVTAVHSYEDCSLWQFEEASRRGKACIYDMPIGYYPAWEKTIAALAKEYMDWLPASGLPSNRWVRPEQKKKEMELADLVLAPSTFVKETILRFHPEKKVALAAYGVDLDFWTPNPERDSLKAERPSTSRSRGLRFIYAGQCSVRKGTPVLLEAWKQAALSDASLELVGSWQLASERLRALPPNVTFAGPVSSKALRERYRFADVFLFPSYFEGFGLVILEAMACGLPVVATPATAGPDILDDTCGRVVAPGDVDALVDVLSWFEVNSEKIPAMKIAARAKAETNTWANYRQRVSEAVLKFL